MLASTMYNMMQGVTLVGGGVQKTINPGNFTEEVIFDPDLQDALQLGS